MDLQRTAGQGEAYAQRNPQPQGPLRSLWGAPKAAPVGFEVCFRIALASRALQVHALFPEPPERKKYLACAGYLPHANYSFPTIHSVEYVQ